MKPRDKPRNRSLGFVPKRNGEELATQAHKFQTAIEGSKGLDYWGQGTTERKARISRLTAGHTTTLGPPSHHQNVEGQRQFGDNLVRLVK